MQSKFDYLISMMMNANIIAKEGPNYSLNPGAASINADMGAFDKQEAFDFQERATETIEKGTDREKLRTPAPLKSLAERVEEAKLAESL